MGSFMEFAKERKVAVSMMAAYVLFVFSANITNLYAPNKETSDRFYTIITPPGWAFAIWGLIFTLQAVVLVAALIPATSAPFAQVFDAPLAAMWAATAILQSLWSFVVSESVDVAGVFLVASCVTSIAQQTYALRRIAALAAETTKLRRVLLYVVCVVPFSIHGGWTAAAAGLNVNLSAVNHEQTPTAQLAIAIGTLLWAFGAAWTVGVFGNPLSAWSSDPAYAGALIWALYAISAHPGRRPDGAVAAVVTFPEASIVPDALSRVAVFAATVLVAAVVIRGAIDTIRFLQTVNPLPPKTEQPLTGKTQG